MAETPQKHESTTAASPEQKRKFSLTRLSSKTRSAWILAACCAVLLVGVVGYVIYSQVQSNDIVVGDTRITTSDRNDYSRLIEEAKKQNPNLDFGGKAGEVALNDLLLNAAFKQEAKNRNQPLVDEDLLKASGREFTSNEEKQSYITNIKQSSTLVRIRNENEAYKQKFADILLTKKDILIAGISFDAPYFNRAPAASVQNLYNQSLRQMQQDIYPVMKSGASRNEVAKKADVVLYDEDRTDDEDYQQYFDKPVVTLDYYRGYSNGSWELNDLDDTSYIRGNVGKLYNTDEKIAGLKEVGDTTTVFASKMGKYMVIRLEGKTNGAYGSWDDFLNHYKKVYANQKISLAPVKSTVQASINRGIRMLTSIGLQQAQAQVGGCASHKVKIVVRAYDVTNQTFISNATKLRLNATATGHVPNDCEGSHGDKVAQAGTSSNTINDNCFTPVPTFDVYNHPSGYINPPIKATTSESSDPNLDPKDKRYNNAGLSNGLPAWSGSALNDKTVYTTFYYHGWELNPPASQVNGGSGWKQTVYKARGETAHFRHKVSNKGPATASFRTWRTYTYAPDSSGIDVRLGPGGVRFIPNEGPGEFFRVPDSAQNGDQFCQSQSVRPGKSGKNNTLTSEPACVVVVCTDQADCSPPRLGTPNFQLELLSCGAGIRITGLSNPEPHQNDNVAIRVRVYPNQQGGGIVVDQNGNPQSDDNFVFRTRGDFTIPWPPGYGNIGWRVDVRAYAYGTYNKPPKDDKGKALPLNSYTTLKANYRIPPCPSWDLTPSTDEVVGFIEQGGSVNFNHYITNNDPFGQGGTSNFSTNTCVIANYDVYSPNAGVGGERCAIGRSGVSVGPGTTFMPEDSTTLLSDGNTPLGSTYCQRYRVDPIGPGGGGRESGNACTKIVGGKTYLSVQPAKVSTIEPGKTGTITASTTTNQYSDALGYGGYHIGCEYDVISYLPYGGSQTKVSRAGCTHLINSNGSRQVVNYSYQPTPAEIGSKICVSVRIWSANLNDNLLASGYDKTGTSCFDVVAKPYMKVIGGDISAGSCTASNSIIAGWNKQSDEQGPGGDGNLGAGAKYAVFAQGAIKSFSSGQDVSREANYGYSPVNLSFANSNTNPGAGIFGGNFGSTQCVLNYSGSKPTNPDEISPWPGMGTAIGTLGSKIYSIDSPSAATTIAGGTIPANVSMRIYVNGDVILNGNIIGNHAGAMDASQMPNFTLIVNGNIYVQPGVTQLYGTYIAENTGPKGNLYTCANGTNPIDVTNYSVSPPAAATNPYVTCGNQLTFTGAVIAKKAHLLRTFGSLYQDTSAATGQARSAEVFKYNPLSWIYGVTGPTTASDDTYESITTLPPVL